MSQNDINTIRQFQIGLNALDLTVIDRYVAPNYISHVPGIPPSKNEWKSFLLQEINAFEEIVSIIETVYEEGGRVYLILTEEFRQIAPFLGHPPDYIRYRMTTVNPYRVENGLIKEIYPSTVIYNQPQPE